MNPSNLFSRVLGLMLLAACAVLPLACTEEGAVAPGVEEVSRGDKHMKRGDYGAAMEAYEEAIAADSANSRAYYGYIKATLGFYGVDSAALVEDFRFMFTSPNDSIPGGSIFQAYSDSALTAHLQALIRVKGMSDVFLARDTSGLLDGKVDREAILPELAIYHLAYATLRFHDVPPLGVFDGGERLLFEYWNRLGLGSAPDLEHLADSMQVDSAVLQRVNDKILELQNGLIDLDSLLAQLGASDST